MECDWLVQFSHVYGCALWVHFFAFANFLKNVILCFKLLPFFMLLKLLFMAPAYHVLFSLVFIILGVSFWGVVGGGGVNPCALYIYPHGINCFLFFRWSLGAIMYEMLVGYPPFYSDDPMSTCRKVSFRVLPLTIIIEFHFFMFPLVWFPYFLFSVIGMVLQWSHIILSKPPIVIFICIL